MKERKSFIVHIDSLNVLESLTNEQAGELFKAIWHYQTNQETEISPIVNIAFTPFKHQFIRDYEKYVNTCKRRAEAGSKGGKQKVANASKSKQKVANVADSKSKSKNDINKFIPNDASKDAVRDKYPNITQKQAMSLIDDFKDQAKNRTKPFKDLQSGFRNYLRRGFIKIEDETKVESFTQIKKMVGQSQAQPMTMEQLQQYALEEK